MFRTVSKGVARAQLLIKNTALVWFNLRNHAISYLGLTATV